MPLGAASAWNASQAPRRLLALHGVELLRTVKARPWAARGEIQVGDWPSGRLTKSIGSYIAWMRSKLRDEIAEFASRAPHLARIEKCHDGIFQIGRASCRERV